MAINAEGARVVHTANGVATFFSYAPIEGATASNLKVWLFNPTTNTLTPQNLNVHYTFGSGGVTFLTPPASGLRVILRREVPFIQPDVYTTNTPFPAKVTENRLDQIVMALQELKDDVENRSIRLPLGDAGFSSSILPPKEARKGKILGFGNPSGDPVVYDIPGATTTLTTWGAGLIAQANSAAGRSYMGATSTGSALFTASSASAARTTLGATSTGSALFTASNAAAARTTLGATSVGSDLFTAASAADARTTLGATSTGSDLFTAASAADARAALGATTVGNNVFTATSAANARSAIGAAASGAITGSGLTVSTTGRLLGRHSAGSGAVEEIVIGSGLALSGNTLSSTPGSLTVTQGRVLGRFNAGSGAAEELEAEVGSDPTMRVAGGILRARRISDGELFIDRFNTSAQGGRITLRRHSDNANAGQLRLWNSASGLRLGYFNLDPLPTEIFAVHHETGKVSASGNATADEDLPRYGQVRMNGIAFGLSGSTIDVTDIPSWATEICVHIQNAALSVSGAENGNIYFQVGQTTPLTSSYVQTIYSISPNQSGSLVANAFSATYGEIISASFKSYGGVYLRLFKRSSNTWRWVMHSSGRVMIDRDPDSGGPFESAAFLKSYGQIAVGGPIEIVRIFTNRTFASGTIAVLWRA